MSALSPHGLYTPWNNARLVKTLLRDLSCLQWRPLSPPFNACQTMRVVCHIESAWDAVPQQFRQLATQFVFI